MGKKQTKSKKSKAKKISSVEPAEAIKVSVATESQQEAPLESETLHLPDEVKESEQPAASEEISSETLAPEAETNSVKANTHAAARTNKSAEPAKSKRSWWRPALITAGLVLTSLIFIAGAAGQFYKNKALPNVYVAGIGSSGKSESEIKSQLESQLKEMKLELSGSSQKKSPSLKEIGYRLDAQQTAENAVQAKRDGFFKPFLFWQKTEVPAEVSVNETLLGQYLERNFSKMKNPGRDARLVFDSNTQQFIITPEKAGTGPDLLAVKQQLIESASDLDATKITVKTTKKPAKITTAKLQPLLAPSNEILTQKVVLQGQAGTFQATPAEIALWVVPTPQKGGTMKLVVDPARVQSYVVTIGKNIASPPQDKKIIKDKKTGKEVVLQEGQNGTELEGEQKLAEQITEAVNAGEDITLSMSITTAAYKTINMKGYDKWIEVDLSEQRTTVYEGATPVRSFIIASGMAGYETPVGEYAIWLKVRKQTMQGGSKADGSYYNIPNVEWVSYFYQDYALHGAWWRKQFGAPASHGCVNMTNADAQWLFNWAPIGTKVIVHS